MSLGELLFVSMRKVLECSKFRKHLNNCYLLRKRAHINKKAELDLNHSVYMFAMLVSVDSILAISIQEAS